MISKVRLWRVVPTGSAGQQAPYILVETSELLKYKAEAEAVKAAMDRSRLGDFKEWTFSATCLEKVNIRGKWLTPY